MYELNLNKAYCLNQTVAHVWQHCDGKTAVGEIAYQLKSEFGATVDESVVWLSVKTLMEHNLLEQPVPLPPAFNVQSRRKMVRLVERAAIALPVVFAITAPTAADTASDSSAPLYNCLGHYSPC
ncbi:MAG: PqqD family protein, partial [Pyrinomonadaceae bacterium]